MLTGSTMVLLNNHHFSSDKISKADSKITETSFGNELSNIIADYGAPLRKQDKRVDIEGMVSRLLELDVNTYFWLIRRSTDWEDLQIFLPKAAAANLNIWVYLVPPSEPPASEPFQYDYEKWAEEIAKLSLHYPNLKAWVIDDFLYNQSLFTPQYVAQIQLKAKTVNPKLGFLPLLYFTQITSSIIEDYRKVIDGVVVAYPNEKQDITIARSVLNDKAGSAQASFYFPVKTSSRAGDYGWIQQEAIVESGSQSLSFFERDSYTGTTAGYHFKQLLVNGIPVWEKDVAGDRSQWNYVEVDISSYVINQSKITIAFRLLDKAKVGNFSIRWNLSNFKTKSLKLNEDFSSDNWQIQKTGQLSVGIKTEPGTNRFHIPFIVMTAADTLEFKKMHGNPASPERVTQWLKFCMDAWREKECEGVVTFCLDKKSASPTFNPVRNLISAK